MDYNHRPYIFLEDRFENLHYYFSLILMLLFRCHSNMTYLLENFLQISFNSSEVFGNSFPEGDGNKEKPAPKNKFMPFLNFCKKIFSLSIFFILFSPFNILN